MIQQLQNKMPLPEKCLPIPVPQPNRHVMSSVSSYPRAVFQLGTVNILGLHNSIYTVGALSYVL